MIVYPQRYNGKRWNGLIDLLLFRAAVATRFSNVMVFALALLLQGCVPMRFTGYQPSGLGSVEGRYCVAGIKDVYRTEAVAGVQILTRAGQNSLNDTIKLHIELIVPEGTTVQLLSLEFVARSPEWAEPQILPVREIGTYVATKELQIHGGSGDMGYFNLKFIPRRLSETPLPKVDIFTLQFPPLRINDQVFQPESISFHAYKE